MEPSAAEQLRALNWTAITAGLQSVAAIWARLRVDQLPVKEKTLESLQMEYRDLFEAMPISQTGEIEAALRQFTRALRLKGDVVTATQKKYLQDQCGPRRFGQGTGYVLDIESYDGTYEYIRPILNQEHGLAKAASMGALFYIAAHRSLGVLFPTFSEEFRDRLLEASAQQELIDESGCVVLGPVIKAHSRWIADLIVRKAEPVALARADGPDYGEYDEEQTMGSWLDDLMQEEPDEDDSGWSAVPASHRHKEP
jgi:hypothetical protein